MLAVVLAALVASMPVAAQERIPVGLVEVVDGDTLKLDVGGGIVEVVRIVGVDTPETRHPERGVECWGPEASARTAELVAGGPLTFEVEVHQRDPYKRLLGYVFVGERNVSEQLAAEGHARLMTIPPNVRYVDQLVAAQQAAREQGLGLWAACPLFAEVPPPEPTAAPTVQVVAQPPPTSTPVPAPKPVASSPAGGAFPAVGTACPPEAPIKGNRDSMIYHLPGQQAYNRTKPEQCFSTESAAVAAGYRRAQR
jgi:micrococcal nuclease